MTMMSSMVSPSMMLMMTMVFTFMTIFFGEESKRIIRSAEMKKVLNEKLPMIMTVMMSMMVSMVVSGIDKNIN